MADYQKYDNLPIIQINTFIKETLSEYYEKVNGAIQEISLLIEINPNFIAHCPICGGKHSPQFIGYYYRHVIDEKGNYYKDFPIGRYKCRSRGKTFSLLPYQLVPYRRHCIPFITQILKLRYKQGLSIYKVQDCIARLGQMDILNIAANQINRFKNIVIEAINKINALGYYPEFDENVKEKTTDKDIMAAFIEFAQVFECFKVEPSIKGESGLNYDFYINGGGYYQNAQYLFGTASQFR